MSKEIERKFLVTDPSWIKDVQSWHSGEIEQGYLCHSDGNHCRIRITRYGNSLTTGHCMLGVKGNQQGIVRDEFEYNVPYLEAVQLMNMCGERKLKKIRYSVYNPADETFYDVDEYQGLNKGLITAEVEISTPDCSIIPPKWCTIEITNYKAYSNYVLTTSKAPNIP